jgi:Fe-S-cluster-containing hydrogenase component 2
MQSILSSAVSRQKCRSDFKSNRCVVCSGCLPACETDSYFRGLTPQNETLGFATLGRERNCKWQGSESANIWFYVGWRKASSTLRAMCRNRRTPMLPTPKSKGEIHWNAQQAAKSLPLKPRARAMGARNRSRSHFRSQAPCNLQRQAPRQPRLLRMS